MHPLYGTLSLFLFHEAGTRIQDSEDQDDKTDQEEKVTVGCLVACVSFGLSLQDKASVRPRSARAQVTHMRISS